jgi:hypothetical protein
VLGCRTITNHQPFKSQNLEVHLKTGFWQVSNKYNTFSLETQQRQHLLAEEAREPHVFMFKHKTKFVESALMVLVKIYYIMEDNMIKR